MEKIRVLYLCTAVDEETKKIRHIQFDSPAATNKVFGLAKALQLQGVDTHVVSLGRGKQTGSHEKFPVLKKTLFGFTIHYAAFWHFPILTHLVGAFSLAGLVHKLIHRSKDKVVVIAYNRLWHYIPALMLLKIYGSKSYLDLEDGTIQSQNLPGRIMNKIQTSLFSFLCHDGALLAAKTLKDQVKTDNTFVCYGCTEVTNQHEHNWSQVPTKIVFGGSLLYETGAQLLMDAITLLESQTPDIKQAIQFTITGYGTMAQALSDFASSKGKGWINFLGEIDRETYLRTISEAQIGLCLKLSSSQMGKTTFPSKIVEYASHGLTIVSTRVSDVPDLLDGGNAILLEEDTPLHLVSILQRIGNKDFDLQLLGRKSQEKIDSVCSTQAVGINLKHFFLKDVSK